MLRDEIGKRLLIFDGATGTVLQEAGLRSGELPDTWSITHPDDVLRLHKSYLSSGCDIIKTNTFVTSRLKHDNPTEIAVASCKLARQAVTEECHGYVALDIGPTGKLLPPAGDLEFEDAISLFSEVISAGAPYCDCVLIETMSDIYEAKAAVIAAKESCSLPIFVTLTMDEGGHLLTGADIVTAVAVLEGLGVDALGLNCGLGPDTMEALTPALRVAASTPIIINPNAGLPTMDSDGVHYVVTPDDFADAAARIVAAGASLIGGCCGTTPEYIEKINNRCRKLDILPIIKKNETVIASQSRSVIFGNRPVIIGERINPTGKPKMKEALRTNDIDYLVDMAFCQLDAGADALDVNCGLPGIDESEALTLAVKEIQGAVNLPLQIDTSDTDAMAAAMRIYNGKPIINSVCGKRSVMDAVFPLIKKYGGVAVGLTLDENGIPETAEGRFAIARNIIEVAAEYGIDKKDIIIDTLTMAAATVPGAAEITLEALHRVRTELGVNTVLGVSNISFGLPARDAVNAAFFTLALNHGLTAAIINPQSEPMMSAYRAYRLLCGDDASGLGYVFGSISSSDIQSDAQPSSLSPSLSSQTLTDAIVQGHKNEAVRLAAAAVSTRSPLDIINTDIIPALSKLGSDFETNRIFLPQLLVGADAATAACDTVKSHIKSADASVSRGIVILATVRGDVHDIGKNIVHTLLENYGFDVHDLGRDVPAETVVNEVVSTKAKLVGLSALMTTTVPSMKETIQKIKAVMPDCLVMVGGAVLTQAVADMIGADFYAAEATASVRIAERVYEQ